MKTIEYRTIDKSEWPRGAWDDEPDKKQWADPTTGLPCLARRHERWGNWCGYVGVPKSHPLHGHTYDDLDLEVHGGLTFSAACGHGEDPARGICHVPDPDEPDDVWWFGFDCHHAWDYAPGVGVELPESLRRHTPEGNYRDLAYVEAQIAGLAQQLAAAEKLTR